MNVVEEYGFIYIKNLGNDILFKDIDGVFEFVRYFMMNLVVF